VAEEVEYKPEIVTEEDAWATFWEMKKGFMAKKIAEKKDEWHRRATSEEAEKSWAEEVVRAAREKRRSKGLKKITPDEWVRETTSGIMGKTITEDEKRKWAENSAPYRDLVKYISRLMKQYNIKGRDAMRLWERINFEILKPAKRKPELIPQLRPKAEAIVREFARKTTVVAEIKV